VLYYVLQVITILAAESVKNDGREREKLEKTTPTSLVYWRLREKQPEGRIDMWNEKGL